MDMLSQARPVFSVVIPMYNEAEVVGEMHRRLAAVMATLAASWEAIYVNDGSRDASLRILETLRQADRHIAIVNRRATSARRSPLPRGSTMRRATQ